MLQERVRTSEVRLCPTRDRRCALHAVLGMGKQVEPLRRDGLVALDAVSFHIGRYGNARLISVSAIEDGTELEHLTRLS